MMKSGLLNLLLASVIGLVLLLPSCRYIPVSVCDLISNPRKYASREYVTVRGVVTESTDIFIFRYYKLKDMNGECEIMVIPENILPNEGEELMVKGILDEAYKVGNERLLVLKEKSNN
jgi:hypothetical protein